MSRFAFASAVYIREGSGVLLVLHKRIGQWVPVGGELKPNETPWQAACREVEEETSVFVAPSTPKVYLGYEEYPAGVKGTHGIFSFLVDFAHRHVRLCDEHSEQRWVDTWTGAFVEEVDGKVPVNVRRYLSEIRHLHRRK